MSVKELTEATLSIVSPEEVFLVEYYDPEKSRPGSVSRGPQGFGASDLITICLPFIYSFFSKYVESLGTEAGKKTFAALGDWVSGKDQARIAAAKAEIKKTLVDAGMPEASLEKSADAILAVLSKS